MKFIINKVPMGKGVLLIYFLLERTEVRDATELAIVITVVQNLSFTLCGNQQYLLVVNTNHNKEFILRKNKTMADGQLFSHC